MTLATLAHTHPRVIDWGIRLDRAPAAGWLALQAGALMPHWIWMVQRLRDGFLVHEGILDREAVRKSLRADSPVVGTSFSRLLSLCGVEAWCRQRLTRAAVRAPPPEAPGASHQDCCPTRVGEAVEWVGDVLTSRDAARDVPSRLGPASLRS